MPAPAIQVSIAPQSIALELLVAECGNDFVPRSARRKAGAVAQRGDDGSMTAPLPPDILAVIDHFAGNARGYRPPNAGPDHPGTLKFTESDAFKSELMLRTSRWARDRVPVAAFRQACLDAGLSQEDTDKLAGYLQNRQNGKRLVQRATRFRPGATFDGVIRAAGLPVDADGPSDLGVPSEDW